METASTFEEIDLEILSGWLGNQDEGWEATVQALETYGDKVGHYILRYFPVFDPHEISDLVMDSIMELYHQGQKQTLPQDKPVLQLLFRAALCNAKDAIAKRTRFSRMRDNYNQEMKVLISGTNTEKLWNSLNAKGKFQDLKIDFLRFVKNELKGSQKIIAGIVGYRMPDPLDYKDIQKELNEVYNDLATTAKIAATWDKVRQKFKEYLKKHSLAR